MYHGTYIGNKPHLKGLTALIVEHPMNETGHVVQAQFDDFTATDGGESLAFKWHNFYRHEFAFDEGVSA